jgi:hypothetical protein
LHDVRFSLGATPQACYDDLRAQWWGRPDSLHIDSWTEISQVDGYDISLSHDPSTGAEKLFFLNLGGYTSQDFEEVHKNILVVATSQRTAIQRAVQAQTHWTLPHKDSLVNVEKAISLSEELQEKGLSVHLKEAVELKPQKFISKYIRLNLKAPN